METMLEIVKVCVVPLLGILTKFIIDFIRAKSEEVNVKIDNELAQKYNCMIAQTIIDCVIATNQTYVDTLKKQDAFTKEAQEEAFQKTYEAVMKILSEDAKQYIIEATGDVKAYVINQIEAQVKLNKA